ncbi:MAG TPA: condensation domain-containing protein, partial [Candidatus Deferrimicrobium sp.]|nr:condensation domain-containing protein [Candidatus Deferrimicrobium sp.]
LLNYPGIKEAAVLAHEEETGDKYLCAYFVSVREHERSELQEYLSMALPEYMIPAYFMPLEKIPLTPSGKIDRRALPKPGLKAGKSYIAPRNEIERKLVGIWSEVLGRDALQVSQLQTSIGIHDNFFQSGGHSLKATLLVSKIHKVFNVKIPLVEIFKNPTISGLSNYIGNTAAEAYTGIAPVEQKEYYVLSSAERRLHFLQEMDKDGTAYNIPVAWILEGVLDRKKLADTFVQLVKRHESFRTSFIIIGEEPVRRVHNKSFAELFQKRPLGEDPLKFIQPFDLSQAPLLRVGLLNLAEDRHMLLVDMHHIISDGMSSQVLARDFSALYAGNELPGIKVQYKDYAEWQKRERVSKNILEQGEFWEKEFEGEIPVLELPADYARPAVYSFEGNKINFEINKETAGALKTLALETGTTLYMLLLALYTIFLSKLSNREDIVVGTPVAGRRHDDLEKIIGMFVNTLATRNYPAGEKMFRDFLAEVKEKTLKAFENQEYPYEDLVEKVTAIRDVSRNPLFDTMFVLQNTGSQEIAIP